MREARWSGLKVRIIGEGHDGPVVVLLHGFGAPGDDLVSLAGELKAKLPAGTRFVFPEAPIAFDLELGFGESRAWWMIDMEHMQSMLMNGRVRELVREIPEGLAPARTQLIASRCKST